MSAISSPQPSTTDTLPDPYGFSQVSGFYGPGAWAACVIAIISSWLAILKGNRKLNYDLIAHLLYTNWAAIDLFRQLSREGPLFGLVAAPVVVCYWGVVHGFWQHIVLDIEEGFIERTWTWPVYAAARIMPVLALSGASVFCVMDRAASLWAHAPETMDTAAMRENFKLGASWAISCAICVTCMFFCITCSRPLRTARERAQDLILAAAVGACAALPVYCMTGYFAVFWRFVYGAKEPEYWFLKPCTAQSIAEWDQAFSLLCALVYFMWEFGPDIYSVIVHRHWVAAPPVKDGAE